MKEHTQTPRETIQRRTAGAPARGLSPRPFPAAPSLGGGQRLDKHTQSEMSARFGHDFSSVRIHTDRRAGESAEALGAHAYALGSDIAFAPGRYQPGSSDGDRLLAHELTHVVQQARFGQGTDPTGLSRRGDAAEREADSLAEQARTGQAVQVQAAPTAAVHLYQPPQAGDDEWGRKTIGDGMSAFGRVVEAVPGLGNATSVLTAAGDLGAAGYDAVTGDRRGASRSLRMAEDNALNAIPLLGNIRAATQAAHDVGTVRDDFGGVSPEGNQNSVKQAPAQMDRLNSGLGEVFGGLFGTEEAQTVPTTGGA